jgi:hypothetical protein
VSDSNFETHGRKYVGKDISNVFLIINNQCASHLPFYLSEYEA